MPSGGQAPFPTCRFSSWLRIANELSDTTTAATEELPLRIPIGKWEHLLSLRIRLLPVFTFGIFCAAMLAQPAITNIEEVIGLSQNGRVFGSAGLNSLDRHFPLIAYGSYVSYQVPE